MFCIRWSEWNATAVEKKGAQTTKQQCNEITRALHKKTTRCNDALAHVYEGMLSIWCCALYFGRLKSLLVCNYEPGALKVCHNWMRNEPNDQNKELIATKTTHTDTHTHMYYTRIQKRTEIIWMNGFANIIFHANSIAKDQGQTNCKDFDFYFLFHHSNIELKWIICWIIHWMWSNDIIKPQKSIFKKK